MPCTFVSGCHGVGSTSSTVLNRESKSSDPRSWFEWDALSCPALASTFPRIPSLCPIDCGTLWFWFHSHPGFPPLTDNLPCLITVQ